MKKSLSDQDVVRRTADLVVQCGFGGRAGIEGKPVHVYHSVPAYPLTCAISEAAYKIGARRVDHTLWSPRLDALHVQYASDEGLVDVSPTWANRWNDLVAVRGATVRIEGVDDPLALARCDPKRVARFEQARMLARQHFYDEGLHKNITPWNIIPFATEDWARLIFPSMSPGAARRKLQRALVEVLGLHHPDYIKRWWARGDRIAARSSLLNEQQIDYLIFKGPGTNLKVGLSSEARFGGGMQDDGGVRFFANLPTFENYTTPDFRRTEGRVQVTRPVLINGQTVDGLTVWFKDGVVSRFTARVGRKAFAAMLETDDGAKRLGEVALVGIDDSPIFSTGIVFQSVLLDENAACHIAFGRAYSDRLVGGTSMSAAQKAEIGCNESKVHRDCMISNEETTVVAVRRDGSRITVIEDGAWAGPFANP